MDKNEIRWYHDGEIIHVSTLKFNITEDHYPTVSMYYPGYEVEVSFDEPFDAFPILGTWNEWSQWMGNLFGVDQSFKIIKSI